MHTAPYFSAFGLLTILLAVRVVALRLRHRVAFGTGDGRTPDLARRIRVFGNFIEFVPIGLILLIALEFVQTPTWYMHICGTTLLLGRILHAIALEQGAGVGLGRRFGMVLTFISLLLSSIGVTYWSLMAPSL